MADPKRKAKVSRRNRNLARNPAVCVHLESGSDVVILYGEVDELGEEYRELAQHVFMRSARRM